MWFPSLENQTVIPLYSLQLRDDSFFFFCFFRAQSKKKKKKKQPLNDSCVYSLDS